MTMTTILIQKPATALWHIKHSGGLLSIISSYKLRFLVLQALIAANGLAQSPKLTFGVVAGVSPTAGFPNNTLALNGTPPLYTQFSSRGAGYLVGVMAELPLPRSLAVEVDGIYHPLNFKAATSSVLPLTSLSNTVLAWNIPVLAKYRAKSRSGLGLFPFVEAGPSFRFSGNQNDTALSRVGTTAGVGAEIKKGRWRFAPTVRYTRWSRDRPLQPSIPRSNPNQIEVLLTASF